ncbi:MAG: hypothetical protein JZU65_07480 [Chlorobium sp.]|nr:hypothetical protein [Chlorobium sp.]
MIREIIQPISTEYVLHIPQEYINKKIEIIGFPLNTPVSPPAATISSDILEKSAGILKNRKIDPMRWQNNIRNEWNER